MTFNTGGSERVRIDTSGNLLVGTSGQIARLGVVNPTGGYGFAIQGQATDGQSILSSMDRSGTVYTGNITFPEDGSILFGRLNTGSQTTRMTIDSSGNVGIGGTPTANRKLELLGSFPVLGGNANSNGIYPVLEVPSAITGSAYVFRTGPSIAASTATTNVFHYLAANVALGSGASLTNSYGFYADAMTSATNNYGFYSNIASGSNRWNFYAAGTANNYFAGNTSVGTTTIFGGPQAGMLSGYEYHILNDGRYLRWNTYFDGGAARYYGNGSAAVIGLEVSGGLEFYTYPVNASGAGASATGTLRLKLDLLGNVRAGAGAIATNATDGFLYVPTCAVTPTGTPTAVTGLAPIVVDTTNNKLYFYSTGQWRDAGP
jgi:hypothetical protein